MTAATMHLWDDEPADDLATPAEYRDIAAVNQALRQLAALEVEAAVMVDAAKAELERIREWQRQQQDRLDARAGWVRQGLQSYLEWAGTDKVKSPNGTAYLTRRAAGLTVTDEAACLAWAERDEPELIRVKRSLDMAALKKHVAATGEQPDGTEITPEQTTLAVRLAPALTRKED